MHVSQSVLIHVFRLDVAKVWLNLISFDSLRLATCSGLVSSLHILEDSCLLLLGDAFKVYRVIL